MNYIPHFVTEPYKLYKRGDILVKCGFDLDGSENSKNQDLMDLRQFTAIIDETDPTRTDYHPWPTAQMVKNILNDGTPYWSLVCSGGWFEYALKDANNPHSLFEVSYDYCNPGIGQLDLWVNGVLAEVRKGPSTWSSSMPHKAIDEVVIRGRQRNFGLSDPPARGELDNLCIYSYNAIDCEIYDYNPPKALDGSAPKMISSLRGHPSFQTTQYIGTQVDMGLRFLTADSHTDFLIHADDVFVFCDDKGTYYRGTIELGDCKRIGKDLYEQSVVFRSPNKLGEGWK